MATRPTSVDTSIAPSAARPEPGAGLAGLAELAFGSLTRADEASHGQHLALLHAESLELDLSDPAQRQFGDYELLEQIGEGGMGVVYRARHLPLDRVVAVKLLSAGPWASREFIARFEREAQNAARMQHPNIVTVFEAGAHDGLYFFSMQLVEGQSLSALLKRGERLTPRAAAALLRTVAEAVGYAHSLGVLHLDLKPGNILIDRDGVPHVADFGLARRLDSAAMVANDEVSGTPAYMAPEQARVKSSRLTAATDVWGLGAILYELLTGTPPFRAESAQATLKLVLEGHVRAPRRLQPKLPLDLQAVALRCLSQDPAERYPSARALADDLARFVEGRPVQARPLNAAQRVTRWARREPRLALTAGAAVVALLAGLATTSQQWYRADRNAATARTNAATASERLWDSRNDAALRFMEQGQDWDAAPLLLANLGEMDAARDGDRAAGMRKRLGIVRSGNPVLIDAIPAQNEPVAIAFDAAGARMVTSGTESGLRLFDTADGKEVLRVPGQPHEVWSRLQFVDDSGVLLTQGMEWSDQSPRPARAHMRRLDTATGKWLAPPAPFAEADAQSYSANGRYAVLTLKDGRAQAWAVDPWHALGPLGKLPWADGENPRLVAPNGRFFALNGPDGFLTLVDSVRLKATKVALGEFGHLAAWAVSPDSRWLAAGDVEGRVAVVDTATLAVRSLSPRPVFRASWLAFSAEGSWLALAAGAGGVYLWSWPDGKLLVPPFSGNPSPGGAPLAEYLELDAARNLVFVIDATNNTSLWQVAPTGLSEDLSEARRVMAGVGTYRGWGVEPATWSPGGGLIASSSSAWVQLQRTRPLALKVSRGAPIPPEVLRFDGKRLVKVDGHTVQVVDAVTERPLGNAIRFAQPPGVAELTADGTTLVVTSGRELHAFDAQTGKRRFDPVALDNSPARVELSPDGSRVAATWLLSDPGTDRATSSVAVIHSLSDGRRLGGPATLPGLGAGALAFSPDGSRIVVWSRREVMLRDGVTLAAVPGPFENFRVRGTHPDSHRGYVRNVAIDAANRVELVFVRHDGTQWLRELRRYRADGTFAATPLERGIMDTQDLVPLADGQGTAIVANGSPFVRIVAPDGTTGELPDEGDDSSANNRLAVSRDGRWVARTRRDGVSVFDLHGRVRVATLRVALARPDEVLRLAFSPDGNRLLGRTVRNRYIVWDIAPDPRPADAIAQELRSRDVALVGAPSAPTGRVPDAAARAVLRATDPGPVVGASGHSAPPAVARHGLPGGPIPPRDPAAPPELLDLTPYYTFGLGEPFSAPPYTTGDFAWLPTGIQRFQDIDFDVRGGARLDRTRPMAFDFDSSRGRPIAAIDALVVADFEPDGEVAAVVRLEYAGGGAADAPLRITDRAVDYWASPGAREAARLAASGIDARSWLHDDAGSRTQLWTIRALNPHPERAVRRLIVEPASGPATTAGILALTLEGARPESHDSHAE